MRILLVMHQRALSFVIVLLLVFQFASGGRAAHLDASGEASLCFSDHSHVPNVSAVKESTQEHCPCQHHQHTEQDQPQDKEPDQPGHSACKSSLAFAANNATNIDLPSIDFAPALIAAFPELALDWPKQEPAPSRALRAPPRSLVDPPGSLPVFLSLQQIRL
ncbi:MAG: hypothetical protein KDB07_11495 [Planctomycetes bacterium]|nr:hypothetical protein [Planctomycetota bacterium]